MSRGVRDFRLVRIVGVLARHGVAHLAAKRPVRLRRFAPMADTAAPDRLRILLEDLGGSFVKFGQMLALQPDILPLEYCNALFDLLDRVEPFPYREVERIVAEELGGKPGEIFDEFDPEPLATASVGQVHVAYLGESKVAVKVQRPSAEPEFTSDIRLMSAAMRLIRWLRLKPLYWLLEPMGEFVGWTKEELDYRHEARYSERLLTMAGNSASQYVPRVYTEYTTRRTLVVEFLDGVTLLGYLRARDEGDEVLIRRLEGRGFDRRRFAANVIDNFLGDAFRHGIYHADLHPANLMILEDSVVGYIDFGITGVMSQYSRHNLMAMTLALARGDTQLLNDQFLKLSAFDERSDLEGFEAGLEALAVAWYEQTGEQRRLRVSFTQVMTDMLNLSRRTGVMPERDIIKYIRSAIAIDGLIVRFEADFHVGRHLEKSCARHLQWQQLHASMSYERLSSFATVWRRLLVEGPVRSNEVLDRLASGSLPIQAEISGPEADRTQSERGRALYLAGVIVALALLMSLNAEGAALGWNLFTVEAVLFTIGFGKLLPVLGRLAQPIE